MGIDQFFSFGPEVPFRANQVFTNREQQIQVFHERFVEHVSNTRPVPKIPPLITGRTEVVKKHLQETGTRYDEVPRLLPTTEGGSPTSRHGK